MPKWLDNLLARFGTDERALALEREVQSLRLELDERDRAVTNLSEELERQRSGASARVAEAVETQVEQLLADAAAPVAQLRTQMHLLEAEGKPVQARDVLAVAKRLVRTLEDNGLGLEGSVGEAVPFDPNHHEPLSAGVALTPGQPVVLRFVGVVYRGKLLRKAGVEAAS
jgi:molecular chaperone GrpE (heat shock protein)